MLNFLASAHNNNVSFFKHFSKTPLVVAIKEVNDIFLCFSNINFNSSDIMLPNFLTRCHSAYLGAIRLATSGEVVEACMVSRGCLENALYALHIYEDSEYVYIDNEEKIIKDGNINNYRKVKNRLILWLDRSKSSDAKNKVRNVFSNSNVQKTLKAKDKNLGQVVSELYDHTIDYGAHPNLGSVASTCHFEQSGAEDQYLISPDHPIFLVSVQKVVEVGICSLLIFRLIFEKYVDVEISERLNKIVKLFPKNLKKLSL